MPNSVARHREVTRSALCTILVTRDFPEYGLRHGDRIVVYTDGIGLHRDLGLVDLPRELREGLDSVGARITLPDGLLLESSPPSGAPSPQTPAESTPASRRHVRVVR